MVSRVSVLLVLVFSLFFIGCSASKPKPSDVDERPSLLVRPQAGYGNQQQYALRVGVLTLRDQRLTPFYRGQDQFFQQDVSQGLSDSIYLTLKSSQLFSSVKRINTLPDERLDRRALQQLAVDNNVDALFVGDITTFNLLRRSLVKDGDLGLKMGGGAIEGINDYQLSIEYELVGQLILSGNSQIFWAEQFNTNSTILAEGGAVTPAALGRLTQQVVSGAMADMVQLIQTTGQRI